MPQNNLNMPKNHTIIDKRLNPYSFGRFARYFSLVIILVLGASMTPHPYHVSYTQIHYYGKKDHITVSVEMFTDDLEREVKTMYHLDKLFLGDSLTPTSDSAITAYCMEHLNIYTDEKKLSTPIFLPSESNPDRTTIYFEFENVVPFNTLTLRCNLLTSLFKDQQNIIEVNFDSIQKKALLNSKSTVQSWSISNQMK